MKYIVFLFALLIVSRYAYAQSPSKFNGLDSNLGNLYRLSDAKTRSISPENFTGEPGKEGWRHPTKETLVARHVN